MDREEVEARLRSLLDKHELAATQSEPEVVEGEVVEDEDEVLEGEVLEEEWDEEEWEDDGDDEEEGEP